MTDDADHDTENERLDGTGDFFKALPERGDIYVLKYILHDWEENRARAIESTAIC